MREDVVEALNLIKQACSSINANFATHQQVQAALTLTEDELKRLYEVEGQTISEPKIKVS